MSKMVVVFMILPLVLAALTMAWGQGPKYYDSFEGGLPDYFTATRPESLGTSLWHYKHGNASLCWDWQAGEELVIRREIGDVQRTGGLNNRAGFSLWLYAKEPVSDALLFEFRDGDQVTGSFRFPLEFKGWRQARLFYHAFPEGAPTSEVDNIRIVAPSTTDRGAVFLDLIKYNTLIQVTVRAIDPEVEAQRKPPTADPTCFPRPESVTEEQLAGIRHLLQLLEPDEGSGIAEAQVNALCEKVEALGIVRDEHGVRGPGLDANTRVYLATPEEGRFGWFPDEYGPDGPALQDPGELSLLGDQVARAYRVSNDARQRSRLREAFVLLADHLLDQGQAFSLGGFYHDGHAVFLMRDVLAQEGLLEPHFERLLYTGRMHLFFVESDAAVASNMDFYAYFLRKALRVCLTHVEPAEQVRWLNAFKALLERSILQPTGGLKIDGSAWHHGGHYFAYARNAFRLVPAVLHDLGQTPWRLSPEAQERFRRAMLAQRIYCNQLDVPHSQHGRQPFHPCQTIDPQWLDALARCGTPDGTQEVDLEVAAAYLRLVPEAANEEPYRSLGVEPEPDPNGTFVMPYAGVLCHRRDNWLAHVKGLSRYVWGSERQAYENCLGLYQGLGQLEILAGGTPVSAEASGYQHSGWDWRRYEGTTTPQLPLEQLEKGWTSISTKTSSPEVFMGGLSHQAQQGIFAMILNQTIMPDTTLTGKKTWFFEDDRIICLGSDISCNEAEYPTQTTLCQRALRAQEQGAIPSTLLDGAQFSAFPDQRTLDEGEPHWFIDLQQAGYCLPAGQSVTVARQRQVTIPHVSGAFDASYLETTETTEGDFLTAWIDHGMAPENASYEYMLVIQATPERLQSYVGQPPYKVIQCDQNAHIVWHTAAARWSCVFFAAHQVADHITDRDTLPVTAVDRPCLIMAETGPDGQLHLSVADPDLNLQNGVSQPRPLRIALRGPWRLLEASATICAWDLEGVAGKVRVVSADTQKTVLEVACEHGASYNLTLGR